MMTEFVVTLMTSLVGVFVTLLVSAVKNYILAKGGKKALEVVEILAKNAVLAVEQVAEVKQLRGADKLLEAKLAVLEELEKYHIKLTDEQLTVFIEAAVYQMTRAWKGE